MSTKEAHYTTKNIHYAGERILDGASDNNSFKKPLLQNARLQLKQ